MNPEQLANDRWAYIEALLNTHSISAHEIEICGYYYKIAFIHGYKNAVEDMEPVILSHSKRREDKSQLAVDEATHNINEELARYHTLSEEKK